MNGQRHRYYETVPNTNAELMKMRVEPAKFGTKNISSKDQTLNIPSKAGSQPKVTGTLDSTPTLPVQSHSLPSHINKKRSSDVNRASNKKAKINTKRRASFSNELHDEQSIRKGLFAEEGPDGIFQPSTNIDNITNDMSEASKDFAAFDGDLKRSLQAVILSYLDLITHIKHSRSNSIGFGPLGHPADGNQQRQIKRDVAQSHLKHEAESMVSESHPTPSSPSSYEEDFSIVEEEDDDDVPGEDNLESGQFAKHTQTGHKVNRATAYRQD